MSESDASLSRYIKIGWAIGELSIAAYVGITMGFFLFFLTQAHGISPVLAGLCLLVPRLWDAISDPIMGAISDRTCTRMGRRRPFLLVGSILFGVSFYFTLAIPNLPDETAKAIYFTLMYVVLSTAYTIYDVPYSAMIGEMSQNFKERTNIVGYKMIAARVGILLSVSVSPIVFTSQDSLAEGFRLLGMIAGIFIIVTGLIAVFMTRDAPRVMTHPGRFSLVKEFRAILANRPFKILFGVFLFQNLAIGATATCLIYYITMAMRASESLFGPLMMLAALTSTLATPLWVMLVQKFGKKKVYTIGLAYSGCMALPAFVLPPSLYLLLFGLFFLIALGDAGNQLLPNSMVADTIEVDEMQNGVRREGTIFGAWAFCRKAGMAGGAFLTSVVLAQFGFISDSAVEQSDAALLGIRIAYSLLPFLLWLVAFLLLRRYDLTEARFVEIKDGIRERMMRTDK
jgi:GPH family glycoside/pentoside/hexuronide:cation symporter